VNLERQELFRISGLLPGGHGWSSINRTSSVAFSSADLAGFPMSILFGWTENTYQKDELFILE
jgi:hypothetical protein